VPLGDVLPPLPLLLLLLLMLLQLSISHHLARIAKELIA